jgi:argininosuccinate synthase
VQAIAAARYANEIGAGAIAHGSTGAGNDQVRFDMVFQIIAPAMKIITPIRDLKLSREQEITYLKEHKVEMNFEKAVYSINKGIWGTSVGGRETLTSHTGLPESAYPTQLAKQDITEVTLEFVQGELMSVDGVTFDSPVEAIQKLQELASPYAIGRDIHVGDTIIGIKGRVGFEAAAPLIIVKAHHLLEKHTLTKWQLFLKDQTALWYGNWLHEGQYFDPVMRDIEAFFSSTQRFVTGKVFVKLMPYRFELSGIESAHDLMSAKFGSYGEMNKAWTGDDVKGFTKIFGNQTGIYFQVNDLNKVPNEQD